MNNLPVVRSPWRILILVLGFTFLYAPMLMLVIYSFNSSKLVTVWAGWSTRWYSELFHDDAMMSAVGLSLTIAACAATMAAILGTIAAVVMVRFGRFRGANGFAFMITAPLVMPDVITGLAVAAVCCPWSCDWLAVGSRHAHHLAGACDLLYGLCRGGYLLSSA
jgi:putrescine transport system permease protein